MFTCGRERWRAVSSPSATAGTPPCLGHNVWQLWRGTKKEDEDKDEDKDEEEAEEEEAEEEEAAEAQGTPAHMCVRLLRPSTVTHRCWRSIEALQLLEVGYAPARHKDFSDLYERMSGEGASARRAHSPNSAGSPRTFTGEDSGASPAPAAV